MAQTAAEKAAAGLSIADVKPVDPDAKSDLVIVYHRQPYEEVVGDDGAPVFRENKSPNGIVPTLKSFFGAVNRGAWVAWKQVEEDGVVDFDRRIQVTDTYGTYNVSRLPLTADQVKEFYAVTSKEALWPILHSFPSKFNFDPVDWENFKEVNRRFAEAACEEAADDALIWVHDYNLWLCPGYIREIKPNARIAFFHHTPFPSADIFNILPWREEIVDSLLACDLVGFHIPRYAQNFVGVCRGLRNVSIEETVPVEDTLTPFGTALSEPEVTTRIKHKEREVRIDAFPVGTNTEFIAEVVARPETATRLADIHREVGIESLILSVGRVDYTKGTYEMLDAYDRLLTKRPDLHGKVKLMVTSVAANTAMQVYRETQEDIERIVGHIHGKYATLEWGPIMLFTTPIPFEQLVAYFRAAQICWTTPMRDGLNLVAKEYIAAHQGAGGALVLSEFTGVHAELPDAIPTNPYSPDDMVAALERALAMPMPEQVDRMARMYANVVKYNISHWADHTLDRFREIKTLPPETAKRTKGMAAE